MNKISSKRFFGNYFYLFIAFIAAFAGILFGYDTGVISGAILFITEKFNLSPQLNGIVVATVLLGALIGALISGRLADYYGRKSMLITDAVIFIIGTIISSIAPDITTLIVGRFIVGIAIGISSYVGPLYISEISPADKRGALVSLNQLAITIGIFLSYIIDYFYAQHAAWRWMFATGIIPAIVLLLGVFFLPGSPRWKLSKGEEEQAMAILNKILGHGPEARLEFEHIKRSLEQQKGNWKMLFSRKIRPTLIIAMGIMLIQQFVGINTLIYYAPTIMKKSGFLGADNAILATAGIGAVNVIFTIISIFLIDRIGRRPLLLGGVILITISLAMLAWVFHHHADSSFLNWLAFGSMIAYIMGFAISLGPIAWLIAAEIFPLRVRGLGSSLATSVNWGANWLVAASFLTVVQFATISGAFLIYFIISIFAWFFIFFFVPETKATSLERIEQNLYAGKSMRHLGDHT